MARSRQGRARRRKRAPVTNATRFQALRAWLLPEDGILAALPRHGNTKWTPAGLLWLALCWAWSDARHLADAFTDARACCQHFLPAAPLATYQGFLGALVTHTPALLPVLRGLLQQRMAQCGGRWWRRDGWVPIAFDGSRHTAPRTAANEAAFGAAHYGSGKTARYRKKKSRGLRRRRNQRANVQPPVPQPWITLLWHMGLRLPWSWRLGPSDASERAHVLDMVGTESFPPRTLFCGDAGFIGYPLWAALQAAGHDFLVRVGANVHLLLEQAECQYATLGADTPVLCWPKALQRREPPLRLRLLQVRVGATPVWLLTSVRDPAGLSAAAAVRFYQLRWGIEVGFRGLKQTYGRAKLRSRNDRRVRVQLDWAVLAVAVAELFAQQEQLAADADADPGKRSLARTLRALRACLRQLPAVPAAGQDLPSQLRAAVTDDYQRQAAKRARYRPPNPDKKPLGDPKLRPLNADETLQLQNWEARMAA